MRQIFSFILIDAGHKGHFAETVCAKKVTALQHQTIFFALTIVIFLVTGADAIAETYYSQGNVPVNIPASWNTIRAGGGSAPDDFTGTHTWIIQTGHDMTITGDWIVGGTATVSVEGIMTVSSIFTVAITGTLTVNGTLTNAGTHEGTSAVTASGGITVNGSYNHARNGGVIPTATWAVTSDCNITGITTTAPTIPSATQPFGNFTWNCPLQDPVNNIFLHGQLTSIAGDLNIVSTHGTDSGLKLGDNLPGDLTVNGDYIQTGGRFHLAFATARKMTVNGDFHFQGGVFYITAHVGAGILDVKGNFLVSAGTFNFINYWLTTGVLNVSGNCSITSGEFRMSKSSGIGTLNLTGNFSHTGGLIWEESTGSGSIVFNGTYNGTTGMQTYTSGGTITENINFTVKSGAYLKMAAASTAITGSGTFTLSPGGTLGITSAEGIATTGTSGNIQVTGTRTFNNNANYTYSAMGAQITGDGLPLTVNSLNTGGSSILSLTNNPTGELPLTITSSMHIASGTTLIIDDPDTSDPQAVTVAGTLDNDGIIIINSDAVNSNGSLVVNATAGSNGIVTYNRVMPDSLYRYISSPVSSASLPSGRTYWLWDEPTGAWVETTACESGRGYKMQASGSTVSFNGSIVISASQTGTAPYNSYADHYTDQRTSAGGKWGGGGWNLLGNPFTSAMDVLAFINHNNGIIDGSPEDNSFDPSYEAVYIYNGSGYYYIAPGKTGYEGLGAFPTYTDIQAGQGFFALANFQGVTFNFTSAMQTHNTLTPMTKSAEAEENPWPGLQLKVKYGEKENSTLIVYSENMTAGLDPGYDVGQLSSGPDVEIYTTLVVKDNSVNFARQALPITDCDKNIIPVGIDSEKGGEVTFSAYTVPLSNYKFWLEDRTTGIYTDLNTSAYTVTLPAQIYGTGRFFIIASTNIPTGINDLTEEAGSELRIWTTDYKVIIKGEVSDRAVCEIYDITGRKIMTARLNDSELNTLTLPSPQGGVYIVRVLDGGKVTTHKVAIL